MKRFIKGMVLAVVAVAVAGALIFGFLEGRKERTAEAEREAPIKPPSRVSAAGTTAVVSFDENAQRSNAVKVEPLARSVRQEEVRGAGVVLQVQTLLDLRTSYSNAVAQVAKAEASLKASLAEYDRLRGLYEREKNAAAKAVEAARATMETDQATLNNAQEAAYSLSKSAVLQRWGPVVSEWLLTDSDEFRRVLAYQDVLVQVTPPAGGPFAAPPEVQVQTPDGKLAAARFVSAYTQVDPRVQAPTYLYITPAQVNLVQGMNVAALLPSGPERTGVLIPTRAVVWWQGRAWAYIEQEAGKFARREVPTSNPVPEGWFVAAGFKPGEKIVTEGAQSLLSEEFRSQIQSLGEDENKQ